MEIDLDGYFLFLLDLQFVVFEVKGFSFAFDFQRVLSVVVCDVGKGDNYGFRNCVFGDNLGESNICDSRN